LSLEVEWTTTAMKALRRLDRKMQERISASVDAFAVTERGDVRVYIEGEKGELALRVGEWRVFIIVDRGVGSVRVKDLRPRGRAYR